MLLVLFNWLYIIFFCCSIGALSALALERIVKWPPQELQLDRVFLLGMIVLTTICNIMSLFHSIDININIAVFVLILPGLIIYKNRIAKIIESWVNHFKALSFATKIALLLTIIIALVKTVGPALSDDEGGYHLPLIRWIENYPIVPGIANIEDRMGFNPGIYMTNAFFSMTWLFEGGLYDLNSLLFVIFSYSFLQGFENVIKNNFHSLFSTLIQVSALVFLFRAYLTTMDADFINIYGAIYILILFIQNIEKERFFQPNISIMLYSILFAFMITCKFSIGILAPLFIWQWFGLWKKGYQRFVLVILLLCGLLVITWIIRNYFISGYLVYPLYFIDVFNVDWKVPIALAQGQYFYVGEYARMEITQSFNEYVNHSYSWHVWFPIWLERIWGLLIGKLLILTMPIAVLSSIYLFFGKAKDWRQSHFNELLFLAFLLLATFIWFIRIPAIRFAWGWLLVFLILSLGLALKKWLFRYQRLMKYGIIVLIFASLLRGSIASIIEFPDFIAHLFAPMKVREQKISGAINLNSIQINIAEDNSCWGIEPPCFPRKYHPGLTPRGDEMIDGFKIQIN